MKQIVADLGVRFKVKIWKYPGASSIYILDHIKPSLRKAPEQIIVMLERMTYLTLYQLFKEN